jgi:hypothetical protein
MSKLRTHTLHRYSQDLERIRHSDDHLVEALNYLRKCDDSDRVLPLIAAIRRVRTMLDVVFESALPRAPGSEANGNKKRGMKNGDACKP